MGERLTLSIKEAAEAVGVSENTLRQSIREGRVPAIRISERRLVIPKFALMRMLELSVSLVSNEKDPKET
jgi:excisionase family DNA binding protein